MSKSLVTYSVDPGVLEQFNHRVPKNQRSSMIEELMKTLIKNNKYGLEKTEQDLEQRRSEVVWLEKQVEIMKEARTQETLVENSFDELWKEIKRTIDFKGSFDAFRADKTLFRGYAKRCRMSLFEFDQACLEKLKS
jgi:hypothetical protein